MDASALTKLVIHELETGPLQDVVRGRSLVSSRVAIVEVTKAVARANPDADPCHQLFALLSFVEFDRDLASVAGATGGPGLRSLDAIHIAAALRLGVEIEAFITYDTRQAVAARAAGLHVISPGSG
ncbi:MAG: type II toxin-antitoxin system VapC family toxin [Candidatus Limnocylindrales bacterium]|nr:type II toxin-antitoxin system VapC family toxin [Candidatus Limnocylindrales bacterium]